MKHQTYTLLAFILCSILERLPASFVEQIVCQFVLIANDTRLSQLLPSLKGFQTRAVSYFLVHYRCVYCRTNIAAFPTLLDRKAMCQQKVSHSSMKDRRFRNMQL